MNKYANIRCVLFDLDGTLVDSAPGITRCFKLGLEHFGISEPDPEKLLRVIGPPLGYSFAEFYGLDQEQTEEAIRVYRAEYTTVGYRECIVYDGIRTALEQLRKRGVVTAVATSKPEATARDVVSYLGLDNLFDLVRGPTPQNTHPGKKDLILSALHDLGIEGKEGVCMVGDRLYDMEGARDAGVLGLGALWGFGSYSELSESGAAFIAEHPSQIIPLLFGEKVTGE